MKKNLIIVHIVLAMLLTSCVAGPIYRGQVLDNFDGKVFVNRTPLSQKPLDVLSFGLGSLSKAEQWPSWIDNKPAEVPPASVSDGIRVTYINHATTLIQLRGLNILTDPIYSKRASPFQWAGPKRVRAPGISMSDLPNIDVILISHNHYDHLDVDTLKKLTARQEKPPLVLSGLGVGELLSKNGISKYIDMQWGQVEQFEDVEFSFVECRHRSGRGISDQMKTLWGSFVIKSASGNVYFAGDTGYGPHLKEHGELYGPFALSILPIGAYEPRWFMADVHMNPDDAVKAHEDLKSEQSLSIHFGVFQLTYEKIDGPAAALATALEAHEIDEANFWTLEPGEARSIR
ncbi:MAG: L-ascorbate metabolism protein UlaG (beta-lactamase superfamily) [Candidatus Azotimanducaceae bacterium]|jgi:L-ascorbate metabolism protein UlaG (beta-lactamase superfamily)